MTKKKPAKAPSVLTQPVPYSEWTQIRASQRITYPDGAPDHMSWRTAGTYTGGGLAYRGQERRPIISLTGRPL